MDMLPLNEKKAIIARFVASVLRPLARMLIRFGCSYKDVADIVRWAFVHAFYDTPEFWRNEKPTAQQGSLKTGLTRIQVERLRKVPEPDGASLEYHQNLGARVLAGWVNDAAFHVNGKPSVLPAFAVKGPSFNRLVRRYGTDANTRAVIDDLKRAQCIEVSESDVRLVNQTYGLSLRDSEKLHITGNMLRRFIETAEHNLLQKNESDRRLKRVWRQLLIPDENVAAALEILKKAGVESGRGADSQLAVLAHPVPQEGICYREVGIVIYVYEGETGEENVGHEKQQQLKEHT